MRSRDHDPRLRFQRVGGVVEQRRRNATDTDDIATAFRKARNEGLAQTLGGDATVAADRDSAEALFESLGRKCAANPRHGFGRQIPVDEAANVVSAKYLRRDGWSHARHA